MLRNRCGTWARFGAGMLLVLSASLISFGGLNAGQAQARNLPNSTFESAGNTIAVSQLPSQAQGMMTLIAQGGPFRYDKDGTVFGNREQLLPAKNRGYYLEYTVKTPSERSRGARRIICGGLKPAAPDTCYYTDNHYASFRRIVQ